MLPHAGDTSSSEPPVLRSRLRELDPRKRNRLIVVALLRALVATAVLLVIYSVLPVHASSELELTMRITIAGALILGVIGWQLWAVNRAEYPQLRAIEALAVSVSVVLVAFAIAYLNLSDYNAASFNEPLERVSSLYFTMTTMTTIGYGDIASKTDPARIVVMVQMVSNVVLIGASARLIMQLARYRSVKPVDEDDVKRS